MNINEIKEILSSNGIKPSLHRMKIYDYIIEHKNHPTVDMIFQGISSDVPTLSRTTIYNTLKIFMKNGVVQPITIEENELRFDADITEHCHFKCIKCNEIFDFPLSKEIVNMKEIDGNTILGKQLYFHGVCKNCKN